MIRWTPINYGLPENDEIVLVVAGHKTVIGFYQVDYHEGPVWRDHEGYQLSDVSHWAPIPLPPNE